MMTINRWGSLASFLLAATFVIAPFIYLIGNLRDLIGVFAYSLADFLYGPALSAGLVTLVYLLREYSGERAKRRMDMALLAAVLAAVGMAAVAFIRAANRQYHLNHPGLGLESSETVLIIWTALVAGVNGLGFHFLGWVLVLLGSANWSSGFFPRSLSMLYFLVGASSWFVYLFPDIEGLVLFLGAIAFTWQGVLLWKNGVAHGVENS